MPPIDTTSRGDIFRVPPDAVELQHDNWWHWYILLGSDEAREQGLLVYGTGSDEEHEAAPPLCLDLRPPPNGPEGTGVTKWTHFASPAIMRVPKRHLFQQRGALPPSWRTYLAAKIREGIGFGTGLGIDQRRGSGAQRGKIVRFSDVAKERFNTRFGMLLTAHDYARVNRYQCVVPIYDSRRTRISPESDWIHLDASWAPHVTNRPASRGFYAVCGLVTSLWAPRHLLEICDQSFTRKQLEQVEKGVFDYLVLTLAPTVRPSIRSRATPTTSLAVPPETGTGRDP